MGVRRWAKRRCAMHKHVDTLPEVGHSRWKQIEPFVGVSRETWRKLLSASDRYSPFSSK